MLKQEENPLLTIIVPAYNVEKNIAQCLDSLVNQTVKNHKVIIINDGSSDKTEKICLEYKNRYSDTITYFYQDNQGLGEARNVGLEMVNTRYVSFLDSDDWLNIRYVECFSKLINKIDEQPDMVFTLPWVYDSVSHRILEWKDKERFDRIFECTTNVANKIQTNSINNPELYALEVNACRKIYKTSFLKSRFFSFPKHLKWEDVPGHFYLLHEANSCVAMPEAGFFYRINQGGQITAGGGASRLDIIPIFEQLLEVEKECNFNEVEKTYVMRLMVDFSMWFVDATNTEYIHKLLSGLHEIYKKFTQEEINAYLNQRSLDKVKEGGFILAITSKDYLRLADYEMRNEVIKKYSKPFCKKNLVKGGVQCMLDHGVIYTMKYTLKKFMGRAMK